MSSAKPASDMKPSVLQLECSISSTALVWNRDRWLRCRWSLWGITAFASFLLDGNRNEAMKVTETSGAAGRGHTADPTACWHGHPQRPLHCKSGLRKGQAPKGPWTVSLSSPWPASERTLSLCFYFPNHDRKAFRYPYPTPKNAFKLMTSRSSLNQPKTKTSFIIQKTTAISYYSWV